jgi:hypothetical protein
MSTNQRPKVAYGLSQPYFNASALPIITTRDPLTTDFAEVGTIWINQTTPKAWLLAKVVANQAIWIEIDNTDAPLGITWHIEAGVGPIVMAENSGYYLTNAAAVDLTLPAAATLGSQIWITTADASAAGAGIRVTQGAAQRIRGAGDITGAGAGAKFSVLDSRKKSVAVLLICTVANTQWDVVSVNAVANYAI